MKKLKLEIIMALKKGVIEMKKKIFIIAGIIAITFLMILGFETKIMQKNRLIKEPISQNIHVFFPLPDLP